MNEADENPVSPRATRRKLPSRAKGYNRDVTVGGQAVSVSTTEFPDGTLGGLTIDIQKKDAGYNSLANCFAQSVSLGLQYGIPLEEFVDDYTFYKFAPAGDVVGDPRIIHATSILD